jgi:predicted O-methyltransferase YrrM
MCAIRICRDESHAAPGLRWLARRGVGFVATYEALEQVPPLVQRTQALARSVGFSESCIDEVGRFLHVLAAQVQTGVVGEIGTGCGVGSAWILSALPLTARLATVELDPARAVAARSLFAGHSNVQVLSADWHDLPFFRPFSLMFPDGGTVKEREPDLIVRAMTIGGLVLLDDLTPARLHSSERDPVRHFWLNDPRLVATEVTVRPDHAVILATRIL